jgi:hypothetical protein
VVLWGDEAGVGEGGQVEEDVGEQDGDAAGYFVEGGELWPGGGEVEEFADEEEEDEEYLMVMLGVGDYLGEGG